VMVFIINSTSLFNYEAANRSFIRGATRRLALPFE